MNPELLTEARKHLGLRNTTVAELRTMPYHENRMRAATSGRTPDEHAIHEVNSAFAVTSALASTALSAGVAINHVAFADMASGQNTMGLWGLAGMLKIAGWQWAYNVGEVLSQFDSKSFAIFGIAAIVLPLALTASLAATHIAPQFFEETMRDNYKMTFRHDMQKTMKGLSIVAEKSRRHAVNTGRRVRTASNRLIGLASGVIS